MSELLTHSRKRAFRECQRKHHVAYDLGIRPVKDADALRIGTLWDDATSEWDRTREDLDAAIRVANRALDPFEAAKIRALLRGYHARWAGSGIVMLASQPVFNAPLINPATRRGSRYWRVAGKLDGIVRDGERTYVLERKTTSENITPGSDYWKRLRIDGQVSDYFDGAAQLGYQVDGCLYDVVAKPGLKPLQVNGRRALPETPEAYERRILEDIAADPAGYFGRVIVTRLEAELADARWDTWQIAKQIRQGQKEGHAPKNPEACTRFGTCWLFDVCTGGASLDDRSRFRIVENKHPELTT